MSPRASMSCAVALALGVLALGIPDGVFAQPGAQPVAPPAPPGAPLPAPNPPGLFAPTPQNPAPSNVPAPAPAPTPGGTAPTPTPIAPPTASANADAGTAPPTTAVDPGAGDADDADGDEAEPEPEPEEELPAPPEGHAPELEVSLDPADGLMTGDLLTVTVRAVVPQSADVAMRDTQEMGEVDIPGGVPPAELLGIESRRERVDDARHAFVFTVRVLVLRPGDHVLGPLVMRVITDDGRMGFARTEPLSVTVGSLVGNEPDAQPRPPTEPVSVLEDDNRLWYVLATLGVLLLGAIIALLLVRWNDRRKRAPKPPPPPRPAWEVALEKLDALRKTRGRALREGETEPWVDGVSDAIREYLGGRYGFVGLESTSDEVVEHLKHAPLTGVSAEDVRAFLIDCDLVKFARAEAGDEQTDGLLAMAYRIVRETRGEPEAPAGIDGQAPEAGGAVSGAPTAEPAAAPARAATPTAAPALTGDERWAPGLSADRDVSIPPTNLALEHELAGALSSAQGDPVVPAPSADAEIPQTRVDQPEDALKTASSPGAGNAPATTDVGQATLQGGFDETVPTPGTGSAGTAGGATTRLEDVTTVPAASTASAADGATSAGVSTLHDANLLGAPASVAPDTDDEVVPTPTGPAGVATKVGFESPDSSRGAPDADEATAPSDSSNKDGGD